MHDKMKHDIVNLATKSDLSLLEALVEYANEQDIDVEILKTIVRSDQNFYEKLKEDAMKLNLLKKDNDHER